MLLGPASLLAQKDLSKSELFSLLKNTKIDTVKIDCYNELCWPIYSYSNTDSAIYFGTKAIELAEKINDIMRLSLAHRRVGIAYINNSNEIKSIFHQEKSYELAKQIGFKKGMANALNNIGVIYMNVENYNLALDYLLRGVKLREDLKDSATLNSSYYNLAIIYESINNLKLARSYFIKSLQLAEKKASISDLAYSYDGIGGIFVSENKLDSALIFYQFALDLNLKSGNAYHIIKSYSHFSFVYFALKNYKVSNEYCYKGLPLLKQLESPIDAGNLYSRIFENYMQLKQLDSASYYGAKAYEVWLKEKNYSGLTRVAYNLSELHQRLGDFKTAYQFLYQSRIYRDSVDVNQKSKEIAQKQLQYEFDKKAAADSIVFAEKEKVVNAKIEANNAKLKQEKILRYVLIFGISGILLFLYFVYKQFNLTKKQNAVIEEQKTEVEKQKHVIEEKQKEMFDSINYAKRLQHAILPSSRAISEHLNHFVYYKPKDIIAGDFYYYEDYNNHLFIAACDCTGHGIPGAMVSVVCSNALTKAITEFQLTDPAAILAKTRELVIDNFKSSDEAIKDGMDASIIVYNKQTKAIEWSGANNPIWIIKNGELEEIKPDKQPVAFYDYSKDFTTVKIENTANTSYYLITDGYADQFGGPNGKKYKYKSLKEFLIQQSSLPMMEQELSLGTNFENWKGSLEQLDDVTIFAFNFK